MVMRLPKVAGQFYAEGFEELDKQIIECFNSKLGPGDLPVSRGDNSVRGIISPHAGYQFSGPAQAWAYKELGESKFPSRFIILGPNHTGLGSSPVLTTLADWKMPFGTVECDKGFAREILGKCDFVKEDYEAHSQEHSIEVQLPFLQFVNKDRLREIKFVPLIISDYDLGMCRDLADSIIDISEDIGVIASSDFTHYGPNYNFTPFLHSIKDNVYALDGDAIELVKKMDTKGFLEYVKKKKATICGAGAIAVCMEIMRNLGIKKGSLLNYYTSGDVVNDYTNSVGYASIKF